jgi:F-box protein 11
VQGVAVVNSGPRGGGIFISYRREETAGQAGRLYDRLSGRFGADRVFMDVDSVAFGMDFVQAVTEAVAGCDVLLALIGRQWTDVADGQGRRRIDDPDDFVRVEIEAALARDIRVVPVLVEGAVLPDAGDLPPELRPLVRRQALVLTHAGFGAEVSRLIAAIDQVLGTGPSPDAGPVAGPGQAAAASGPPTHVVDGFPGRGDLTTVSAAIKKARPGDRIVVRPGLYEEALVVDKPVEIVGDGPVADIEIRARDTNLLAFRASAGRVANLSLRQAGGTENWCAVDITQGRLDLEDCDISSQDGACVGIHDGANPRLRRNKIHDSRQSGVLVYDSGLGTVEDNDITGNALAGVAIKTGGDPTVRGNKIHDNKQAGVHVYDNGVGTVEDNDITGNGYAGVQIKTGGDPTVRGNKIHDNKQAGVYVPDNGRGTVEDNDITGNGSGGVAIQTDGNPTLRRNRINRNDFQAVWVNEGGRGVVEDNDLTGNKKGAWNIAADCRANVTRARNKE